MIVTYEEAGRVLELELSSFSNKKGKYWQFVVAMDKRKMFNLGAYQKWENARVELLEKVRLFIEYVVHIESWTYQQIADLSGVFMQAIHNHQFGYDKALMIAKAFNNNRPWLIERFDKYYNWKYVRPPRKVRFK